MLLHTKQYLEDMNRNIQGKLKIIDYIKGKNVLDAGCGAGELIRTLASKGFTAYGMDLSDLAIRECLIHGSNAGLKRSQFIQGDVCHINRYIEYGEIDTIIFSSVLHEVYSYNDFSLNHVKKALQNAYSVLPKGGRIIIRDGIMSEDDSKRVITFKDKHFAEMINRYVYDFKGRSIYAEWVSDNSVVMSNNDAMEFLYTVTWGERAYTREVKEQFGIMTPRQYLKFINDVLENPDIVSFNHYLQEGYNRHLTQKIDYTYMDGTKARLPDSTAIFVIEKNIN